MKHYSERVKTRLIEMCNAFGPQEEQYLSQRFAVPNIRDIKEEQEQDFLNYTAACLEWKMSCSTGYTKLEDGTWRPNIHVLH